MNIQAQYKKFYGNFILDVRFEIPAQGITILFGPSGSGKSSLLNCIAGLDKAEQSHLKVNDRLFDDSANHIHLSCQRRNIGYVFQDNRLFPHLDVKHNLLYGYNRLEPHQRTIQFDHVVDKFSLQQLLDKLPHQISGGQKQRVALARAILRNPQLLILDEPVSALDYASKQELLPYLERIHKELTIPVLYVSHNIREVLQLGDYMLVMEDGHIVDQGELVDLCVSQPLLTQSEGASFILEGVVTDTDKHHCISTVKCQDHDLLLSGNLLEVNQSVRILVHAKDVSLSLSHVIDSSILNILESTVHKLHTPENGKQLVELIIGETRLLATLSLRSVDALNLKTGSKVFAQIKATAVVR